MKHFSEAAENHYFRVKVKDKKYIKLKSTTSKHLFVK